MPKFIFNTIFCSSGETRTHTSFRTPAFEADGSTNSPTEPYMSITIKNRAKVLICIWTFFTFTICSIIKYLVFSQVFNPSIKIFIILWKVIKLKFSPQVLFNFFCHVFKVLEHMAGFEPANVGFADRCVRPLHHICIFTENICNTFNKLRIELKFCCKFSYCGDGRSRTFAFRFSV